MCSFPVWWGVLQRVVFGLGWLFLCKRAHFIQHSLQPPFFPSFLPFFLSFFLLFSCHLNKRKQIIRQKRLSTVYICITPIPSFIVYCKCKSCLFVTETPTIASFFVMLWFDKEKSKRRYGWADECDRKEIFRLSLMETN